MGKFKLEQDDLKTEALLCAALEHELNSMTKNDRDVVQSLANRFFGRVVPQGSIAGATITGYYMGLSAGFRIFNAIQGR